MLVGIDSRAVNMEAVTGQGVRNSSPAEWVSPENGGRLSGYTEPQPFGLRFIVAPRMSKRVRGSGNR